MEAATIPASCFTAEDSNGSGLVIENNSAHKVELDHFSIAGPTYRALAISQSSNVYIHDLSIQEASQGLVSGLGGAIWIQGGTHVHIDHNVLTNNGPSITGAARNCRDKNNQPTVCPQGYTIVANPNYFAGNFSQSTTTDLQVIRNIITGQQHTDSLALYNAEHSTISDNYVDQNNAYKNDTTTNAEAGQGYGINVYGNAHVSRSVGELGVNRSIRKRCHHDDDQRIRDPLCNRPMGLRKFRSGCFAQH